MLKEPRVPERTSYDVALHLETSALGLQMHDILVSARSQSTAGIHDHVR